MRDDAVGVMAAELIGRQVDADVITGMARGLTLLDCLAGYDRAIIVDATRSGTDAPGTVRRADVDACRTSAPWGGAHEMDAAALLDWAHRTGWTLPEHIAVYTVEAADMSSVGQQLSPAVRDALDPLVQRVLQEQFPPTIAVAESERGS